MFTGIVQGTATVESLVTKPGLQTFKLAFSPGFTSGLVVGASVAVDGVCLTVANEPDNETAEFDVMLQSLRDRDGTGWFEVWLIPETLRATTFAELSVGSALNIEIERQTHVFVDTVRDAIQERLGVLQPVIESLLRDRGLTLDDLARPSEPIGRDELAD